MFKFTAVVFETVSAEAKCTGVELCERFSKADAVVNVRGTLLPSVTPRHSFFSG